MAASKAARGAFILFEGVDRCGKTTQSTLLVETLKRAGVKAELWRYPDRTTSMGVMINSYLQSKTEMDDGAIHLLFAANRWEKKKAMEAALAEGITLVVDRYSYSGVAFTAAKKIQVSIWSGANPRKEDSSGRMPCCTSTCPPKRRGNEAASARSDTRQRRCRRRSERSSMY
jgi:thymidylate kinase